MIPDLELSIQSTSQPLQSSLPPTDSFSAAMLLEPEDAFEVARDEIDRSAWKEALPYLESCCLWNRERFDRPTCPLLLGMAYQHTEAFEQALPYLTEALENFPEISVSLHYFIGQTLMELGRYEQALQHFNRVSNRDESRYKVSATRLRVECLWKSGREVEATEELRRLLGMHEEHEDIAGLLWLKSRMAREKGNSTQEIEILRKIDLYHVDFPEYPEAHERLVALQHGGHNTDPPYGKEAVDFVSHLYWTGRLDDAMQAVERYRSRIPEGHADYLPEIDRDLHLVVADCLIRQQNYKESLAIFRKRGDLKGMAKAYARLGQLQKASKTYDRLARNKSGQAAASARFLAAWILGEDQRFGEAYERLVEYMADTGRNRNKALWFAGWYAYRDERYPEAVKQWETLRKRSRHSGYRAATKYYIARAKLHMGETDKALSELLELSTQNRFSYYRLAAAFRLRIEEEGRNEVYGKSPKISGYGTWRKIRRKYRKWSPWKEETMASSMRRWLGEANVSNKEVMEARKTLETSSRSSKRFPHLASSLAWSRLGVNREAREELRHHLKNLLKAMKNGTKALNGESPEQTARRISHRDYLLKHRETLSWALLLYARSIGDESDAYRIAVHLLREKELRKHDPKYHYRYRYPVPYFDTIHHYALRYEVPLELALAIMRTESGFRPDVVSNVGAVGLMQIMPMTGKKIAARLGEADTFRQADLYDPETSIRYGLWYLGELLKKFQGQWPLAIASYNGGPHNVERWLADNRHLSWDAFVESIPFSQTRNYVKKVLKVASTYRYLYAGEFTSWNLRRRIRSKVEDNINW